MTSLSIDRTVAQITGESLRRIRRVGFSVFTEEHEDSPSDAVQLVLDCPFCRRPLPYLGLVRLGEPPLAECLICDVEFEFDLDEVYILASPTASLATIRRHAC